MNINKYAETLKKSNGLPGALRIAHARMQETKVETWNALPTSVVFNKQDKRDNKSLDDKRLLALHNFWTQVFHILNKNVNKKR